MRARRSHRFLQYLNMSKRSHESATQGESREERWLRKLKLYEEKLSAKRSRLAENQQILPPVEGEVQIEGTYL